MSTIRIKSSQKQAQSSRVLTTQVILKQLYRRQKNNQTNMIASNLCNAHVVYRPSDNLESTRGKSSTQIKRYLFGKTFLNKNFISSTVKKHVALQGKQLKINNLQENQKKNQKTKLTKKQRDQKLLIKLYNKIKQEKQIQNQQKKIRVEKVKKKILRPKTQKPMFSYNRQSMNFLQNHQYWSKFKQKTEKTEKTIDLQKFWDDFPVTPNLNLQKQKSFHIKRFQSIDQRQDLFKSAKQYRNSQEQTLKQTKKNFKQAKTFKNLQVKKIFNIFSTQAKTCRSNISRNSCRSTQGGILRNHSSKFKHPISQIYEQAANSIFTSRKNVPLKQMIQYVSTLEPFGNLEIIQLE